MIFESIEIIGFRGLREFKLSFEKGKALIMYGLNGTGKSSLSQALNFVITGQLPLVSSVKTSSNAVYRHKALDKNTPAYVFLEFAHNNCMYSVKREIKSNGQIVTTASDPHALRICESKQNSLCFLTKTEFISMVDAVERDSWQRLTPFLGHEELANFREGLKSFSYNIKKYLGVTLLGNNAKTDKQNIIELKKRYTNSLTQIGLEKSSPSIMKQELENLLHIQIEFIKYSDIPWSDLEKKLPGGERITIISKEMQALTKELTVTKIARVQSSNLRPSLIFLSELHKNKQLGHDLLHAKFLSNSLFEVHGLIYEPCPLCGQTPDNWDIVRSDLSNRVKNLEDLQNKFDAAKACLESYNASISSTISNVSEWSKENEPRDELKDFDNRIRVFKDFIDLALRRLELSPITGMSQEEIESFENARLGANESHLKLKQSIELIEHSLREEQEAITRSPDIQHFYRLKELSNNHVDYLKAVSKSKISSRKSQVVNDIVDKIQTFFKLVDTAESDFSAKTLKDLESEFTRIFNIITDQEQLMPRIIPKTERGIRSAEIIIKDFYGLGPVSVREYLSEANRNSVGLSIYFAGLLKRAPILNTLVLDDITHSSDNIHRRGLASFIVKELANAFQLIVMTHDKHWHGRIFDSISADKSISLSVIEWSPDSLTFQTDKWSSLLDSASAKILKHDHSGGNILRQAFEKFMNEVCERYKVEFPFKQSQSLIQLNDKRQRLEKAIREAWQSSQGIIDPNTQEIRLLLNSQRITNLVSHYDSFETWDYQDLADVLKDVKDLLNLFTCKNTLGSGVCGGLLPILRKSSGVLPQCFRCRKNIVL
jgi:energy-coupling factor transporter ATP-binding protein EcfA2